MNKVDNVKLGAFDIVLLRGMGSTPIPVSVGIDGSHLILSTKYLLSPVAAIPELIDKHYGNMVDLIARNPKLYEKILHQVVVLSSLKPERYLLDDSLLIIRSMINIGVDASYEHIPNTEISGAIEKAIEQDELIKKIHHNIVEAYTGVKTNVN